MSRSRALLTLLVLSPLVVVFTSAASANHPPGPPDKVTICHKPGTPAEKTLTLPHQAAEHHIASHGDTLGPCGAPPPPPTGCAAAVSDICIDGDGVASPTDGGPAAFEVQVGDALTSFPVTGGPPFSGLDAFDNDGDGNWSSGDDLHVEDPQAVDTDGNRVCTTAMRNAVHDLGSDCKVLDIDGSLTDGQPVDCDVEFQIEFVAGACDSRVRYLDTNGNGVWNSGEDLVLDVNNNGVFD